jgi:hypothetical protein
MKTRRIAILAAVLATLALASSASAASRITGCFSYNGVRYNGLSTSILYKTTSGGWAYLNGSNGVTRGYGCATYNINGRYRSWYLRMKAVAVASQWRGFFSGATPYYSGSGNGIYRLGVARMRFYVLPAYVARPPVYSGLTSSWLDQMNNPCGANASPAMQVACFMDAHGMHGNVVVPPRQSDGDGVPDYLDRWPTDPSRW